MLAAVIIFIPVVAIAAVSLMISIQFGWVITGLMVAILSLFSSILSSIIYLNVKYMDEENSGSYDNRNITDENAIDYNKDK